MSCFATPGIYKSLQCLFICKVSVSLSLHLSSLSVIVTYYPLYHCKVCQTKPTLLQQVWAAEANCQVKQKGLPDSGCLGPTLRCCVGFTPHQSSIGKCCSPVNNSFAQEGRKMPNSGQICKWPGFCDGYRVCVWMKHIPMLHRSTGE